jgi:hypothetical protein
MPLAWPTAAACCLPPPCAAAGIEEQIARLSEIESLQEEWQIQVGGCAGWLWWLAGPAIQPLKTVLGNLPVLHELTVL